MLYDDTVETGLAPHVPVPAFEFVTLRTNPGLHEEQLLEVPRRQVLHDGSQVEHC